MGNIIFYIFIQSIQSAGACNMQFCRFITYSEVHVCDSWSIDMVFYLHRGDPL